MTFDILKLERILLVLALIGLGGNQYLYGERIRSQIEAHNAMVQVYQGGKTSEANPLVGYLSAGLTVLREGDSLWEVDYLRLFADPTFPYRHIEEWTLPNHVLAWGGLFLALVWGVMKYTIRVR